MWHFSMEMNLYQTRFKTGSVIFKLHMQGEKKEASTIPAPLTLLRALGCHFPYDRIFPAKEEEADF